MRKFKYINDGFTLVELVVVIAVLAILSAVAIPAFVGVQANARASAVKNGMVNGIKECVVRASDNKTTLFADAQAFNGNYTGYGVAAVSGNTTCYAATATATNAGDSNFTIVMDTSDGSVAKTCTDVNASGCNGSVVLANDGTVSSTTGTW